MVRNSSVSLSEYLDDIRHLFDIVTLLNSEQNNREIQKYYIGNRLAYHLIHHSQGFMHMGLSRNGRFERSDVLGQVNFIQHFITPMTQNVLELGAGNGTNSIYLSLHNSETQFYALDLSTTPLKFRSRPQNFSQEIGDFHNLDRYSDNFFDVVFVIEALCHSDDKNKVFTQVYKKLKRGGVFIIIDGYTRRAERNLSDDETLAKKLTAKSMAVNNFELVQDFKKMVLSSRFKLVEEKDLSKEILPSLYRFKKIADFYFHHKILAKAINKIVPYTVRQNAIAAYLMPILVETGIGCYYVHVLRK